jgi:septum site-determining protein MinC
VIGAVAWGAEVVAGGSIHIYGTARGRVMAGAFGDARARIFCRRLEAELVAVNGIYMTAEEIDANLAGQAVQIWLEGETIKIARFE